MRTEAEHQARFFYELDRLSLRHLAFAIPNGGSRHPAEAVALKKQGVTAGVPDIFVAYPAKNYHGLFIEMKRPQDKAKDFRMLTGCQKSGQHIRDQRDFGLNLAANGYCFVFAWGWEDALDIALWYFNK